MNAPLRIEPELVADRGVLRFITAGSVDDGKSTLIGRLLYDCKGILSDQLAAIERAGSRRAARRDTLDLSLLTDGLEAEREQGITIDVAYRYFATARRKFIIADTPGHEQYTRNMVTGASTADAAVILIDPTRLDGGELLAQTRRHTALAHLLGIRHLAVAINKTDAIGYDRARYEDLVALYAQLARSLGVAEVQAIPVSALVGDNVAVRSAATPWYAGPTLLEWLESVPSEIEDETRHRAPLRLAVQWIARGHVAAPGLGARGYCGRIASGRVSIDDEVLVQPGSQVARVAAISTPRGEVTGASAGEAVQLRLDREIDVSRGDWLVAAEAAPQVSRHLLADLAWLATEPLTPGRKFWLQQGTRRVAARVRSVRARLDLGRAEWAEGVVDALQVNDIVQVEIETQQPLAFDAYERIRASGAFVLIDAASLHTVAAGMLRASAAAGDGASA
jgi:sulfate adenylyltransferase subunit 1